MSRIDGFVINTSGHYLSTGEVEHESRPLPGLDVEIVGNSTGWALRTTTDQDGHYSFDSDHCPDPAGWTAKITDPTDRYLAGRYEHSPTRESA